MSNSTGTISTAAGPLDVPELVAKLMGAEKATLNPLAKQALSYNSRVSAYGNLKNAISTYQAALNGLTPASFGALKGTISNRGSGTSLTIDPLTVDVNGDESTKVLSQKIQSDGFPKSQVFSAGDSLAIKVGANPPKFLTLTSNATLAGVRDIINASKADVTASIVTDGAGDHLVFESNAAGTENTIKIQAGNSFSKLDYDPARSVPSTMTQTQAARDATVAAAGSYSIGISQLAQAQKITSAGFSAQSTFDTGILAIKTGNGSTAVIKPLANTLAGVRDAINTSNAGVTASIVNDGSLAHLVIAAKDSGASNSIRVSGTQSYSLLSFDPTGKYTSAAVASDQTYDADAGRLSLKVGNDMTTISLSGAGKTLHNVRDAINAAHAGVTASVTNEGTHDHLVLSPSGKGAASPVSLSGIGDFSTLTGSTMGQLIAAQDAKLSIDGVAVSAASNKVSNAISGVTLNVSKVTIPADNFALNILHDTSGVSMAATTFVSAYNSIIKTLGGMIQQTPSHILGQANTSSVLAGDSSIKSLMAQLRGALSSKVEGGRGISSLSDVGISFQKDSTLAIDSAKLNGAMKDNLAGVENLFTSAVGGHGRSAPPASASGGVLTTLQTLVKGFLVDGGIVDIKTKGLQASLKNNASRQAALQNRLSGVEDQYVKRFNSLNRTLSSMASTQNYLTQQLKKFR